MGNGEKSLLKIGIKRELSLAKAEEQPVLPVHRSKSAVRAKTHGVAKGEKKGAYQISER